MSFGARSTGTRQTIWRTLPSTWGIWSRIATEQFYLIELNSFQFFSNSCWSNRFQALSDRLCLYQERSSKLMVSKTILTNPCKIIQFPQCGNIYVSHLKKRTPSIIVVTASQFVKLSKLIGMCNLNFTVGKSEFRKFFFSVWCLMQTMYYPNLVSENWWERKSKVK